MKNGDEDKNSLAGRIYAYLFAGLLIVGVGWVLWEAGAIIVRQLNEPGPAVQCHESYFGDRGWGIDPDLETLDLDEARTKAGSMPVYVKEVCRYE